MNRWRLDEDQYHALISSPCNPDSDNRCIAVQEAPNTLALPNEILESTWFPLPADQLLHLIEYNVFRGLTQNKAMLESLVTECHADNLGMNTLCTGEAFPSYSVIVSLAPHLTGCLTPTHSQMNIVHSSWINTIPFPAMRDNLIRRESEFDHSDFIKDLVGELIDLRIFPSMPQRQPCALAGQHSMSQGYDDKTSSPVPGLIIWGEPYRVESWEMTPGFLRKWRWAVIGCEELLNSTNRWRGMRGETPLAMYL